MAIPVGAVVGGALGGTAGTAAGAALGSKIEDAIRDALERIANLQKGNEKQQIKEWARRLGVEPRQVGNAIERIKSASKTRKDIDAIDDDGNVIIDGEIVGNIHDEIDDCAKKR